MSQRTDNIRKFFRYANIINQMMSPRMTHSKIKLLFLIVICSITAYLFLFHVMVLRYLQKPKETLNKVHLDHVIVHFDLKGSPPKLSYLKTLLPMLEEYNVNGLLIEYEDMFPYEGKLVNLSARNAYGKKELESFLADAVSSGFKIIPLVQTFGHLEYALKLPEFKHLRENPQFPDSMCPSKAESIEFLGEMLNQVITFHETIAPLEYIHVGCDEVYHMNSCEHCSKRNLTDVNIFIAHINKVSRIIEQLDSSIKILIWSDMLKKIIPDSKNHLSFSNIIPVYWDYRAHDVFEEGHRVMFTHKWIFGGFWVATAFKGADGATQSLPNMKNRFVNHYNWLTAILKYANDSKIGLYKIEGMILTGWSRYSHLQPPCELLPASVPSLILNLILIQKFTTGVSRFDMGVNEFITQILQIQSADITAYLWCYHYDGNFVFNTINCEFPGLDLYVLVHKYIHYKNEFSEKIGNGDEERHPEDTRSTELEILQQGYINLNQMPELANWCSDAQEKLSSLEAAIINVMSKYFDKYFVAEYVAFNLGRMKKDLEELRLFSNITDIKVWPRRPFNIKWDAFSENYLSSDSQ